MALKKLCPKCKRVIEVNQRYCDSCQLTADTDYKNRQREYDQTTRRSKDNKQFDAFYKSGDWSRLRNYTISWYNDFDVYEWYTTGKFVEAQTVHHIVEIKEDWNKRFEFSNLIPMTLKNHSKIHLLYLRNKFVYQKMLMDMLSRFKKEFK